MKYTELEGVASEDLKARLKETRENYMKMRFLHATGQLDSPIKLRAARKDIARLMTAMSARAKAGAPAPVKEA